LLEDASLDTADVLSLEGTVMAEVSINNENPRLEISHGHSSNGLYAYYSSNAETSLAPRSPNHPHAKATHAEASTSSSSAQQSLQKVIYEDVCKTISCSSSDTSSYSVMFREACKW